MMRRPTRDRYKYATVYINNYSDWSCIQLQKTSSDTETVDGTHAFEEYCRQQCVEVRRYHAVNGIFKGKEWVQD